MKSTLTKREKEQREEWVLGRMDEIRHNMKTVPALRELKDLQHELLWLST